MRRPGLGPALPAMVGAGVEGGRRRPPCGRVLTRPRARDQIHQGGILAVHRARERGRHPAQNRWGVRVFR
eukprot:4447940-Pyramimonas_sp.AAC.1